MFIQANERTDKEQFMKVWSTIALERKYPVTELADNSEAFILQNKDGVNVGTIEFVPCELGLASSNDIINISGESRVTNNLGSAYQVRKMGVIKEFGSKKILLDLLKLAATHAKDKQVRYYVSYLEKRHYQILTEKYKFRIDRMGEDVKFEKRVCVPSLIDVWDAINNTQGYPIHIKSIAYVVRGTKKVKSLFV
ncbi:hypothetical protein ACFFHM_11280 [Halalkalibacter kiskunsagensis]|uniref:N-acetyltransferase domain-containing protein n=1 Tax=Halalkalibacter kiskunsagensis TaxID=1548599 RepID=A0ABV6KGT7_9BACI